MGKRELVALLCLSSGCLMIFVWPFLTMPRVCLQFVIMVFPYHTHLLFSLKKELYNTFYCTSSSCTTTKLSMILTSCLTAIKDHVIKYFETVFERKVEIYFGLLKTQVRFLTN